MKAIFLCERTDRIFQVFDADICEKLHALTGIEKKQYTKADVLADPKQFADVEFIFSTWGTQNTVPAPTRHKGGQ